jgi:Domain of unknown function (DUF1338)
MENTLEIVLDGLMTRYAERVPNVGKTTQAMIEAGIITNESEIENDHIAFRTMGVEHLGLQSFEKIFSHLGYQKRDYFNFESKKLNAFWYAPPADNFPRIFVSELRVNDLSAESQAIIRKYTNQVDVDPADSLDLNDGLAIDAFLHKPLWQTPTWADYEALLKESEYAAWVIFNRYYLNHYTISVHNLGNGFDDLSKFNELVEAAGVKLNDAGGKIKTSPDGGLLQSSSVAEMIDAQFADGSIHQIAGSYIEFAQRKVLPQFKDLKPNEIERKHRRDGFETANADKIFESTFTSQTKK